jgi:hypothetical protein
VHQCCQHAPPAPPTSSAPQTARYICTAGVCITVPEALLCRHPFRHTKVQSHDVILQDTQQGATDLCRGHTTRTHTRPALAGALLGGGSLSAQLSAVSRCSTNFVELETGRIADPHTTTPHICAHVARPSWHTTQPPVPSQPLPRPVAHATMPQVRLWPQQPQQGRCMCGCTFSLHSSPGQGVPPPPLSPQHSALLSWLDCCVLPLACVLPHQHDWAAAARCCPMCVTVTSSRNGDHLCCVCLFLLQNSGRHACCCCCKGWSPQQQLLT